MELEVEVISKEIIKPSSSTPASLYHYQLSFLDQISPPVYNPLVLFYPKLDYKSKFSNDTQQSNHLKQSLSNVLTSFYPLAGRLRGNRFVECNNEGIPYIKTLVKCQLSELLSTFDVSYELNKLVPFELADAQELNLGVQFNVFECGGIAIGLCVSHKIADALSMFMFVKSWAATALGEDSVCPEFVTANLFPPRDISGFNPRTGIVKEGNIVTKRFVFSASKIEAIRDKCAKSLQDQRPPSRVEALSAFIWSRFIAATRSEPEIHRTIYTVHHAVNLRTRIDPPLPEHSFGNLYRIAVTIPSINEGEEFYGLVRQVRDAISKIDKDYVKKLQEGENHLDFIRRRAQEVIRGEMVSFSFTSLCRFPLYEANFGWGKPVWVGSPSLPFKNLVVFLDAKSGDGIEANISLKVEDMAKLEDDKKFLMFVAN